MPVRVRILAWSSNRVEVGHEAEFEERRPDDFRIVVVELDRQQEAGTRVAGRVRPFLLVDRRRGSPRCHAAGRLAVRRAAARRARRRRRRAARPRTWRRRRSPPRSRACPAGRTPAAAAAVRPPRPGCAVRPAWCWSPPPQRGPAAARRERSTWPLLPTAARTRSHSRTASGASASVTRAQCPGRARRAHR